MGQLMWCMHAPVSGSSVLSCDGSCWAQLWDGMLTNKYSNVMVLAATNRPFDLDEAILRRCTRYMRKPHELQLAVLTRGQAAPKRGGLLQRERAGWRKHVSCLCAGGASTAGRRPRLKPLLPKKEDDSASQTHRVPHT